MHFMNNEFENDEKLYRAVYPYDMFWTSNGKVSSAAFKDKNGLSVERGYYRDDYLVVENMNKRFEGNIVCVTVEDCRNVHAKVKYKPSHSSKYHSEIHGSDTVILSRSQAKQLASCAVIVNVK